MPGPTTTSQSVASFDPRSIGGCQLWLDALDTSSITGSSPVTAWRDKSINVTSATNSSSPVLTTSAINGKQAILLNGSSSLSGTSTGSGTTLTVCIVGTQSNGCATNGGLVCLGRSGQLDYADAGSIAITQISSGNMVSTRNSVNSQTTNTGLATPFIYIVIYDGTYVNTYYNGTLQTTANISISGTFAYTNYVIGNRAGSTSNVFWTGYIGEVLIFSQAFTAAERLPIEGYLSSKWGITLSSSTHPFYSVIPFTRTFSPNDIASCILWVDPANRSTLSLTGTNVVSMTDSSLLANSITRYNGTVYATAVTVAGNTILSFPGTGIVYRSAMVLTGSAYTIFVVMSLISTTGNGSGYQRAINADSGNGTIFVGSLNGNLATFCGNNGFNDINANSPTYALTGNGLQVVTMFVSGSSLIPYINGVAETAKTGTTGATTVLDIGAYQDGTSQNWNGYVGDILVYNTALSTSQRQSIEGYLSRKWSKTFSSHPFYTFPPSTVASNNILTNLLLNLDPLYRVSSTSWVPSVGNTWTFSSATTSVSTGPSQALSFSAQYVMDQTGISAGPANSSSFTIEIWFSAAASVAGNLMSEMGQAGVPYSGWHVSMMNLSSNTIYAAFWIGSVYSLSLGAYTANRWTQAVYTYSGTTVTGYVDGVYVSTGTATKQNPGTGFYCVAGGGNPYSGNTTCSIGGVKIYSAALTADQIKQNYNANAWRFKKPYI